MFYSYPSYIGVPIFRTEKNYLPSRVLGMTNGKRIIINNNLPKDIAEFVLFHEEEHVKDMLATEQEVDERALRRFLTKNNKITKTIKKLMKKRHGIISNEKQFSLNNREEKNIADNYISYLYTDSNW